MHLFSLSLKRLALVGLTLVTLSACGMFEAEKKVVKPAAKAQRYSASTYIEQLSIANITLENGGSLSDIADNGKIIEAYTRQKKIKEENVPVVVLEYNRSSGAAQRIVAPIGDGSNFNALSNVLAAIDGNPYKLKDVQLMKTIIAPGAPIKITGQNEENVKRAIKSRHQYIADHGHNIAVLQEAELQIKLLRFFTSAKNRDAAYICADNAKRILSSASHGAKVDQLTKDLEIAEGELRKTLPY